MKADEGGVLKFILGVGGTLRIAEGPGKTVQKTNQFSYYRLTHGVRESGKSIRLERSCRKTGLT